MAAFFGDVELVLQKEFARQLGISYAKLVASAKALPAIPASITLLHRDDRRPVPITRSHLG